MESSAQFVRFGSVRVGRPGGLGYVHSVEWRPHGEGESPSSPLRLYLPCDTLTSEGTATLPPRSPLSKDTPTNPSLL